MDSHIRHFHCRYRILGDRGTAGSVTRRLERVARAELTHAYEEALQRRLGADSAVVVLRNVRSRVFLPLDETPSDAQLARRWGERLAANVVRRIAEAGAGDHDVIRFGNQAEYVAHFLADLLDGQAWTRWYYGAFRHLRGLALEEAAVTVLDDHRDHLTAILVLLARRGVLDRLLRRLTVSAVRRLWYAGLRNRPAIAASGGGAAPVAAVSGDGETDKPLANRPFSAAGGVHKDRALFEQACCLIDLLDLWSDPTVDREALFVAYRPRSVSDWRDTEALTQAVGDVLGFLGESSRLRTFAGSLPAGLSARIDRVLAAYDWLDPRRLRARLLALLTRRPPAVAPVVTPRQRALLEALGAVLNGFSPSWPGRGEIEAWALRVYAALVDRDSRWADDTLALRLIESIAHARVAQSGGHVGDEAAVALPEGAGEGVAWMTALGPAALALLEASGPPPHSDMQTIETDCAGVFLLLRAIADLKLPLLAGSAAYPPGEDVGRPADLLIPLFLRLAGAASLRDGRVDPALALLAPGLPTGIERLRAVWSAVGEEDHRRFQQTVLRVLTGQRLIAGDRLHIYALQAEEGGPAWVAGDEDGLLWPLGTVPDESAASLKGEAPGGTALTTDDPTERYSDGRRALLAALSALAAGRLDLPATDLAMALLAMSVLRAWARWLPRFSQASVPYLLENFIRRRGYISVNANRIEVEMAPAPLDVVIEMAGYTAELEKVDWLGGRNVAYRIRR